MPFSRPDPFLPQPSASHRPESGSQLNDSLKKPTPRSKLRGIYGFLPFGTGRRPTRCFLGTLQRAAGNDQVQPYTSVYSPNLARISHRFLLNGCNLLGNKELWDSAKNSLFLRWCSAETSKRQAREAALSLRSAWSRAPARSRRGSRSVLPRIASRICETSGLAPTSRHRAKQHRAIREERDRGIKPLLHPWEFVGAG